MADAPRGLGSQPPRVTVTVGYLASGTLLLRIVRALVTLQFLSCCPYVSAALENELPPRSANGPSDLNRPNDPYAGWSAEIVSASCKIGPVARYGQRGATVFATVKIAFPDTLRRRRVSAEVLNPDNKITGADFLTVAKEGCGGRQGHLEKYTCFFDGRTTPYRKEEEVRIESYLSLPERYAKWSEWSIPLSIRLQYDATPYIYRTTRNIQCSPE